MKRAPLLLVLAGLIWSSPGAASGADPEELDRAKALFFDDDYVAARRAWQAIRDTSTGRDAHVAAYNVARCSERLKEYERALEEYGDFLESRPDAPTLEEQARTSRAGLAARLYKAGERAHLPLLEQGLRDRSRTVRYYAALQLGGLGRGPGNAAVPVLEEIIEREDDPDLRDRAQLILLRIQPEALRPQPKPDPRPRPQPRPSWIKLRIYEAGEDEPGVSVNVPLALAELVFKALPDDARKDLRDEGIDLENFWQSLEKLGPTEIIEITGDEGEAIRIWLE